MDKDILTHKKFVEDKIAELRRESDANVARDLLDYHVEMTRNFQHERQIHLYVTLFFAMLMIGSWIFCIWSVLSIMIDYLILPIIILTLILTILEGFYIAHYYKLENRTQKLYKLNKEIYKIISAE